MAPGHRLRADHQGGLRADAEKRLAEENKHRSAKTKEKKLEFVFPGLDGKPLQEPKRAWLSICKAAGLAVEAVVEELRRMGQTPQVVGR